MADVGGEMGLVDDNVTITITRHDGNVETVTLHNTVTTAGRNGAADQILAGPTLNKPSHMAVGIGTPGSTALGSELDRNALVSKTRSANVVTMTATWGVGEAIGGLTEAGIFDAVGGGNMWCSASFAIVNKANADTVSISWTLTYTS